MSRQLLLVAHHVQQSNRHVPVLHSIQSQVLELIFSSILKNCSTRNEYPISAQGRVFTRAMEFFRDHKHDQPLTVRDLAAAAHTSERTLERAFGHEFGISPKKFLFGHRIYGAFRQLRQSNPSQSNVADIAYAWGFWHMGQFARDYRRYFGELPSATLQRPG